MGTLLPVLPARPVFSQPKGRTVVILDPGHGGHDWGAVARGHKEKEICLSIARKLKEKLEGADGPVVRLTRESDKFIRLDQRVGMSLSMDGDIFVSLHVNKVRNPRSRGITVYSFGSRNGRPRKQRRSRRGLAILPAPPQEEVRQSSSLGSSLVRRLRAEGFRVDPIAHAQYYVLKNPQEPSLLIEMGYLSNPQEAALLADEAYQDKLASALARGLSELLTREADEPAGSVVARGPSNKPGL